MMHSGTQERYGVVDSGELWIPRAELEGLERMAERRNYEPYRMFGTWSGV